MPVKKFFTKVLVIQSTLIVIRNHQKNLINFFSSGKLRVTTPFFERGNFSGKLLKVQIIATKASLYSKPMFFGTRNRLKPLSKL